MAIKVPNNKYRIRPGSTPGRASSTMPALVLEGKAILADHVSVSLQRTLTRTMVGGLRTWHSEKISLVLLRRTSDILELESL